MSTLFAVATGLFQPSSTLAGQALQGLVDIRLGQPNAPEATTVEACLYTGRNLAEVMSGHVRGPLHEPLQELIQHHSIFIRHPALYVNAHRPDAFRKPPTPVMAAVEAAGLPLRTMGHLRRGEALPPDVTGQGFWTRGHRDLTLLTASMAADLLEHWIAAGQDVVFELEERVQSDVRDALFETLSERRVPWLVLGLPGRRVLAWPDAVPVFSRGLAFPSETMGVDALLPWLWSLS